MLCLQTIAVSEYLFPCFLFLSFPSPSYLTSRYRQGHSPCRHATPRSSSKEGIYARNWKREWIPRAIENLRTLWRRRYKDKVPIVHLWAESTKEPDKFDL